MVKLEVEAKRSLVETDQQKISLARQCQLLSLNRSTLYYQAAEESSLNLELMRLIDKQYTDYPFYGIRRMTAHLRREGFEVNAKRVARLMRKMGMRAIYPEPRTTIPNPEHRIYPYLLRGIAIDRANQVWSCDITYIRLVGGFAVFDGSVGLAFPICFELGVIEHDGSRVLCGSIGCGFVDGAP